MANDEPMLNAGRPPAQGRIRELVGRALEGTIMTGFEKERDRLDGMMTGRGGARISDASGGPLQVTNR
jgi:hypothetical protein